MKKKKEPKKEPTIIASGYLEQFNNVPVYNLDDGQRVFRLSDMTVALRGIRHGKFANYLASENIVKFIPKDLRPTGGRKRMPAGVTIAKIEGQKIKTYNAENFIDICLAFVNASEKVGIKLSGAQQEIVERAKSFIRATAKIGITGLIDEATGYQYVRPKDELALKLKYFLAETDRTWEKTFPDELWKQFGRLTNWTNLKKRPKYWGMLVQEFIYNYLDKDVAQWLKKNKPPRITGKKYHQWLNKDKGVKALLEHIWQVIGIAKTIDHLDDLRYELGKQFSRDFFQPKLLERPKGLQKVDKKLFDKAIKTASQPKK